MIGLTSLPKLPGALCTDVSRGLWDRDAGPDAHAEAAKICAQCPELVACLTWGMDARESGVYGGQLLDAGRVWSHTYRTTEICGTEGGYEAHRRRHEQACESCLEAATEAARRRKERLEVRHGTCQLCGVTLLENRRKYCSRRCSDDGKRVAAQARRERSRQTDLDPVAIARAMEGRPPADISDVDRAEVIRRLLALGATAVRIAALLRTTDSVLRRLCRDYDIPVTVPESAREAS